MFIYLKEDSSARPDQASAQSSATNTVAQRPFQIDHNPHLPLPQGTGICHPSRVAVISVQA